MYSAKVVAVAAVAFTLVQCDDVGISSLSTSASFGRPCTVEETRVGGEEARFCRRNDVIHRSHLAGYITLHNDYSTGKTAGSTRSTFSGRDKTQCHAMINHVQR